MPTTTLFGFYVDTVIVADPSLNPDDQNTAALTDLQGTTVNGTNFEQNIAVEYGMNGFGDMRDADADMVISGQYSPASFTIDGTTRIVDEWVNFGVEGAESSFTYDGVEYPIPFDAVTVGLFNDGTYVVLLRGDALTDMMADTGITEIDPALLEVTLGASVPSDVQDISAVSPTVYSEGGTLQFADSAASDGVVDGTGGDDMMGVGYTDGDGDQITDGDDSIVAGTGSDTIEAGGGNDTIALGNDGESDTVIFADGDGNDLITGFDMPIDNGDGTFTPVDVLDLSGLTNASGDPVTVADISVTDDGSGNAVLNFPNGESITLVGVESGALTDAVLESLGAPTAPVVPDGVVDGTGGDDFINTGYVDADGDEINNDGQRIEANDGNDTVYAGWGDDTILGGQGEDQLFGRDGNDSMDGGADNDSLWGDDGNDSLFGNDGDDKLIGGAGDDLITGGAGDDLLIGDNNPGDQGGWDPSDTPEPGYGSDTLVLDAGNDTAYGGSGDDEFQIFDGFGNHVIVGGEAGETNGDTINATTITEDVSVTYIGDESGQIQNGINTTDFDEIENLYLGTGDDTVEVITSTTGYVNGGDGFDTLVLPDPAPGDPAPDVTVTSTVDNGDGTFTYGGYVVFPDGSRMDFENFEEIICFTPGTLIDTARGKMKVEELVPGDLVLTRDHGYQPLAWTGRRDLTAAELARCPTAAPVRIAAGSLGAGLPERDLVVSPRHRMLVTGARAELMFGEREVLVTAADLLGLPGVTQDLSDGVSYIHVMCDTHQIIRAEGSWTESFQPAAGVIGALDADTRAELLGLFPELANEAGLRAYAAARPVLTGAEARELFAA